MRTEQPNEQGLTQRRANERVKKDLPTAASEPRNPNFLAKNYDVSRYKTKYFRQCFTWRHLKFGLLCVLLLALFNVGREVFTTSSKRGHVWRAYFTPTSVSLWDNIHGGTDAGRKHEGGIWSYSYERLKASGIVQYMKKEEVSWDAISSSQKSSTVHEIRIWDVACNVGYMLEAICGSEAALIKGNIRGIKAQNKKECFGTDISHVMVNKTISNCAHCKRAAQLDLSILRREGLIGVDESGSENLNSVLPADFPSSFEYIIVSDVLLYMPWGGFPPLLLSSCVMCRQTAHVREDQIRMLQNLQRLTTKQILVSDHQQNAIVVDMMTFATEYFKNVSKKDQMIIKWHTKQKLWSVEGTADS